MKKIYLVLLFCLPVFLIKAQTIVKSDLPSAGSTYILAGDSTYNGPIPIPGANRSWDFSTLKNLEQDTVSYISITSTPYEANFPNASLANHDIVNQTYAFYISDTTGFYLDGIISPVGTATYDPNPQMIMHVPFSYSDTSSNLGRSELYTTIADSLGNPLNLKIVITINSNFKADGYGTLTLPSGTYTDVLRVRIDEFSSDSVYYDAGLGIYIPLPGFSFDRLNTRFRFWAHGLPSNYLLGIDADSSGTATYSEYLVDPTQSITPVLDKKKVVAYPNPVGNTISFKFINERTSLTIYDNNGKVVMHSSELNNKAINVETLPNGVYHYYIVNNNKAEKGSFVVQH